MSGGRYVSAGRAPCPTCKRVLSVDELGWVRKHWVAGAGSALCSGGKVTLPLLSEAEDLVIDVLLEHGWGDVYEAATKERARRDAEIEAAGRAAKEMR